jgi:hypothetical protein
LSSTVVFDRTRKLEVYAREGVSHLWLVDPATRTLEVLRRANRVWTVLAVHAGEGVVNAEPFAEIELDPSTFWADLAEPVPDVSY